MNMHLSSTPEAITWCYRIFLGRAPESALVVNEKLQRLKTLQDIIEEFVASPEFYSYEAVQRRRAVQPTSEACIWASLLIIGTIPTPDDLQQLIGLSSLDEVIHTLQRQTRIQNSRFAVDLDDPCKVMILGNCQTDSLRLTLECYTQWKIVNWREHILTKPKAQARILNELRQADIIITQPLSVDSFGPLGTANLIKTGLKPVVIPNIYFAGLHPDLIYLGPLGHRVQSPIGEYHSALACAAFLSGLTPKDALICYEDDALFAQAGLFDIWEGSWSEYINREQMCDVKMADYLVAQSLKQPLFYSVNHPVGEVIDELVRRIIRNITGRDITRKLIRDEFHNDVIYPVWGPIVRRHKLQYGSRSGFYLPTPKTFIPLSNYLHLVYSQYAKKLHRFEPPTLVLRLCNALSARHPVSVTETPSTKDEIILTTRGWLKESSGFLRFRRFLPFRISRYFGKFLG